MGNNTHPPSRIRHPLAKHYCRTNPGMAMPPPYRCSLGSEDTSSTQIDGASWRPQSSGTRPRSPSDHERVSACAPPRM
eukprot:3554407-Pyramimonas_sp.AAC.1